MSVSDESNGSSPQQLRKDCMSALTCLYLAVDECIADDVNTKVKAYIHELETGIEREATLWEKITHVDFEDDVMTQPLCQDHFIALRDYADTVRKVING